MPSTRRWTNREKAAGVRDRDSSPHFIMKPLCGLQHLELEKWRGQSWRKGGHHKCCLAQLQNITNLLFHCNFLSLPSQPSEMSDTYLTILRSRKCHLKALLQACGPLSEHTVPAKASCRMGKLAKP